MTLIDRLNEAIAAGNKSQLEELEAQAEADFAPLRASGQVSYIKVVSDLLDTLRAILPKPPENFARSPEDFAPRVRIGVNVGLREESEA